MCQLKVETQAGENKINVIDILYFWFMILYQEMLQISDERHLYSDMEQSIHLHHIKAMISTGIHKE